MIRRGAHTMRDIKDEVQRLSEMGVREQELERKFGSQVGSMRRDLQLVNRQIDFERERRSELDRQIAIERSDQVPPEHAQAVARREEDIKAIKDEKNGMLEWLQRGVSEAQRLSVELEKQRRTTQTSVATKIELESDRARLRQLEERLSSEVEETREKIRQLQNQRTTLEDHTHQQSSLIAVTKDITDGAVVDKSRLDGDVEKLQQRARDVETVELAVSCLAASVRRCLHTLETLNDRIAKGAVLNDYNDLDDDDAYDSDADADPTRVSTVVLSSTKAKIGRSQALLLTLQSSLKRFETDQLGRALHEKKHHGQNLEAHRVECDRAVKESNAEVDFLRSIVELREPQLRNAMALRRKAVEESPNYFEVLGVTEEPERDNRFGLLRYYDDENTSILAKMTELGMENQRLESKVKSLDADYTAVKELKKQYRELEATKMLLSQGLRELETDNRDLKFTMSENAMESAPSTKSKRPPWKANPL